MAKIPKVYNHPAKNSFIALLHSRNPNSHLSTPLQTFEAQARWDSVWGEFMSFSAGWDAFRASSKSEIETSLDILKRSDPAFYRHPAFYSYFTEYYGATSPAELREVFEETKDSLSVAEHFESFSRGWDAAQRSLAGSNPLNPI